jgi:hypothetical protein
MWKFAKNLVPNAEFFFIIWRFPFPYAGGTCLVSMLYSILLLFIPSMLPGDSRRMETMVRRRISYASGT